MQPLFSYTFVDPEFFESLGRYRTRPEYEDALRELLPAGWKLTRGEIWHMAYRDGIVIPPQGLKIHVSATLQSAAEVLRRVVPECVAEDTSFKVIADRGLLHLAGSKNFGRGSSSKFITIYPPGPEVFKRLIETLHQRTRDLDGPYILSDMRYQDSKVVFYRYGGMQRRHRMTVGGTHEAVILNPAGEEVADDRLPFFQLPPWVEDPFGNKTVGEFEEQVVLNGRYEVESALSFSNRGGVYRALDRVTGDSVIIKEARPFTSAWVRNGEFVDAVALIRNEHAILTKLEDVSFLPRVLDLFSEWEHTFLVEELIEGVPLTQYRARSDVTLIPFTGEEERKRNFCEIFRHIASQLLQAVAEVHARGVLIGDLSPGNVLVDPVTRRVRLIDMESAYEVDEADNVGSLAAVWATPGFVAPGRIKRDRLTAEDDLYALGMLLFSMLMPVQTLFELEPAARDRILARIDGAVGLPRELPALLTALLEGDAGRAAAIVAGWDVNASLCASPTPTETRRPEGLADELEPMAHQIAEYIVSTTDATRTDRLWPGDYAGFQTNGLNLAYGACGTLLFLKDLYGAAPPEAERWLLQRPVSHETLAPSLYLGLSGIAQTLLEIGHPERAAQVMDSTYRSPLLFDDPTLFHGCAGWGLASLSLHGALGDDRWLAAAVRAGEHLLSTAEDRGEACCWRNSVDGLVHYGQAYGASGIALFLLYLHQATGDDRFVAAARRGMAFDAAGTVDTTGKASWVRFEGDTLTEPYWLHGASGVGSTLLRFHRALGDEHYLRTAEHAAEAAFSRFAVLPAQFEGLSGIGEFMLDMHRFTGREEYRGLAMELVESILCQRIDRPAGMAFPGRYLLRISTDFGYGSAGVGAFFHRLAHPAPRRFFDLAAAPALECV